MRTYSIEKRAGYKGCGHAFAKIIRGVVISLDYIDRIVALTDWAEVSDDENPYLLPSGEDKIHAFSEINPEWTYGMCSCWKFCVAN